MGTQSSPKMVRSVWSKFYYNGKVYWFVYNNKSVFLFRQMLHTPVWEQGLYYALLAIGLVIVWITAMLL